MTWRVVCWTVLRRAGGGALVPRDLGQEVVRPERPLPVEQALDAIVFPSPAARAAIEAVAAMPRPVPEPWSICLFGTWVLVLLLWATRRPRSRR